MELIPKIELDHNLEINTINHQLNSDCFCLSYYNRLADKDKFLTSKQDSF